VSREDRKFEGKPKAKKPHRGKDGFEGKSRDTDTRPKKDWAPKAGKGPAKGPKGAGKPGKPGKTGKPAPRRAGQDDGSASLKRMKRKPPPR
jgi:hypothetical protein